MRPHTKYLHIRVENGSAMDLYSAARAVPRRDLVLGHEAALAVRRSRFSSACVADTKYKCKTEAAPVHTLVHPSVSRRLCCFFVSFT